jgi:hypothetical protein
VPLPQPLPFGRGFLYTAFRKEDKPIKTRKKGPKHVAEVTQTQLKKEKKKRNEKITIYLSPGEQAKFNRHHRQPRCQNGSNEHYNLVWIDERSHEAYNQLVGMAARCAGIPIERVTTQHIARFINLILPFVERLFVHPKSRVIKNLAQIVADFNTVWLPVDDLFRLQVATGKKRLHDGKKHK